MVEYRTDVGAAPAVRNLRLAGTPETAAPLVVGSYHLNYASTTTRLAEAEWLTTWNDKWERRGNRRIRLPALLGGDNNSYPEPGADVDPALPVLEHIQDLPHRAHRSYQGPDSTRLMDTRPDNVLRTAGLEDVARYLAVRKGIGSAVTSTVDAYKTHGPQARIDRIYASEQLLPAVVDVEVVDMKGLSDHDTVLLRLDRDVLADILNNPITQEAA
ncbi:hypothetical protein ACIHCQ_41850 [Streptomyces sp. NPDC052236]|uniref:hypothetical protein n=1 Tax=Streptomyces sp. NPDC052236 TaxID=3365686 RepID=UPI0037D70798